MKMGSRTPIQSNVQGFDEILSQGSHSHTTVTSSYRQPHVPVCTKTIKTDLRVPTGSPVKEWLASQASQSEQRAESPVHCDHYGGCDTCHLKRRARVRVESSSAKSSNSKSGEGSCMESFEPRFITEARLKDLNLSGLSAKEKNKWQTIKDVTEMILREKDMLLERQKVKRIQLESKIHDLENQLRSAVLSASVARDTELQIEEKKYEKLSRSAQQFTDNTSLAQVLLQKSQLERELSEAEHTIADLQCRLLTGKADIQRDVHALKIELEKSEKKLRDLHAKNQVSKSEGDNSLKELTRLKLYLADLPTREEHQELTVHLNQAREENKTLHSHIESLMEEKLDQQSNYQDLQREQSETKEQVKQLLSQVAILQQEVTIWEEKESMRECSSEEDVVQLKEQLSELTSDYTKLSQLLEARQKEMAKTNARFEEEVQALSDRVEEAESASLVAQEESAEKDATIERLSKHIKQLAEEKQDLSEKTLAWEENIKTADQVISADTRKLEQSLVEQVVYCTSSLECLINMCRSPGQQEGLDIADMLATRPTPVTISSPREYVPLLEAQVQSLDSVSERIEALRQLILDKYADDLAEKGHMDCAVQ